MELSVLSANVVVRNTAPGRRLDNANPRVYVNPVGESVLDMLINRRTRPINIFRALALEALKQQELTEPKIKWSQKAGCGCGCSPGFILSSWQDTKGRGHRFDVFVTAGQQVIEEKKV